LAAGPGALPHSFRVFPQGGHDRTPLPGICPWPANHTALPQTRKRAPRPLLKRRGAR